jgi:SMC interacting uncharacterized protein involved in chromosome segregation
MTVIEKKELDELLNKLEQQRDELYVQIHLGKAEAKELWQETEDKWHHLRSQLDKIDNDTDTSDAAKDVGAAAIIVAEEIRQGYDRLKKLF